MPLILNQEKAYALAPKPIVDAAADWGPTRQIDPEEIKRVVYLDKVESLADSFPTFEERKAGTVTEEHRNFGSQVSSIITNIKNFTTHAGIVHINDGDNYYGTADNILDQFFKDMLFPFIETDEEATKISKLANQPDEIFTAIKVYLEEVLYIYFSDQAIHTQSGHARLCRRIHQLLVNIFACGPGVYSYLQTIRDDLLDARTNHTTLETALPHIVDNLRSRLIDGYVEGFCATLQVPPQEEIHVGHYFKKLALKNGIHVPGEEARGPLVDPIIDNFLEDPASIGTNRDNFYRLSSEDIPYFLENFRMQFTPMHIVTVITDILHAKLAKVFGSHLNPKSVSSDELNPLVKELEQYLGVTGITPLLFEEDPDNEDHYRFSLHIYVYLRVITISQVINYGYLTGITYRKIQGTPYYLASDLNQQPEIAWLCTMDKHGAYQIVNHVDAIEAMAAKQDGLRTIQWLFWTTRAIALFLGFEDNKIISEIAHRRKAELNKAVISTIIETGTIEGMVILNMEDIFNSVTSLLSTEMTDEQKIFQIKALLTSYYSRRYLLELRERDKHDFFTKSIELIHTHFTRDGSVPLALITLLEAIAAFLYGNLAERYQANPNVLQTIPKRLLSFIPSSQMALMLKGPRDYFDYSSRIMDMDPFHFLGNLLRDFEINKIENTFNSPQETFDNYLVRHASMLGYAVQTKPVLSVVKLLSDIFLAQRLTTDAYLYIMKFDKALLKTLPFNSPHVQVFLKEVFDGNTINPLSLSGFVHCFAADCFNNPELNSGFYRKYRELNEAEQEEVFQSLNNHPQTQQNNGAFTQDSTQFYKKLIDTSNTLDELATVKFIPDRFVPLVSDKAHALLLRKPIILNHGFVMNFQRFPTPMYFTKAFVFFGRAMHETISMMGVATLSDHQIKDLIPTLVELCDTEQQVYDLFNDLPTTVWRIILEEFGIHHHDLSADSFNWLDRKTSQQSLQMSVCDIVRLYNINKSPYRKHADCLHFSYAGGSSTIRELTAHLNQEGGIEHIAAKSIIARKLANEVMRKKGSPRAPLTHTTAAILRRR